MEIGQPLFCIATQTSTAAGLVLSVQSTSTVPQLGDGTHLVWYRAVSAATNSANSVSLPASASIHPPLFTGEISLGNGVYYLAFGNSNIFGYYSDLTDQYCIYYFDLGYEYVFDAADGNNGVYLYDFTSSSFFYTSPTFPFPYLYDFSLDAVLYYFPDPNDPTHYNTNGVRYFLNTATGQIISE